MQKSVLVCFIYFISLNLLNAQSKSDYRQNFIEGNRLILEGNYSQALRAFKKAYQIDSANPNINFKIGFCYLKKPTEKDKSLYYLEKAINGATIKYNDIDPMEKSAPYTTYYYYAQALHLNYRFDDAIANFEKFKDYFKGKENAFVKDVNRQIEMCNYAKMLVPAPINVNIESLGDSINTSYADHSPVLSGNEKTLIFTSRRPGGTSSDITIEGDYYEDIYISYKSDVDSSWSIPVSISKNVNTITHEASIGLTADGQTLLIYKDVNGGDIYYSTLEGDDWTFPLPMGSDINTPFYETSACLSPDGSVLYFVSDRKEGGMGGKDIWKCMKLPNGKWGLAQNLGAPINTEYDEETPFIHPSGTVLFYSSKGHQSIGGYDIFFSNLNENGWDMPLNIGYPINTPDDDLSYVTSPDGKRGYYASSSRPDGMGEKDIYIITIPERKEQPLVLIKGLIIADKTQIIPENIEIVAFNNETGIITGIYKPLQRDGSFTIIIPPGSNYTLSYQKDGEEFHKETMEVPADAIYQEIEKELVLKPINLNEISVEVINKSSLNQNNSSNSDTLYYEARIKTSSLKLNENDPEYINFIIESKKKQEKNGKLTVNITASTSLYPSKTYKNKKDLATAIGNNAKQQISKSLTQKGAAANKVIFGKVNPIIDGPAYDPNDKTMSEEDFERYQYVKVVAY